MLVAGLVGCSNKLKPWMWVSLYGRRLHLKWVCSMSIMCLSWTVLFMMYWVHRVEMEGGGRIIKHWHSMLQEYLSVACQVLCKCQMTLRSDVATIIANLKICWMLGCIFEVWRSQFINCNITPCSFMFLCIHFCPTVKTLLNQLNHFFQQGVYTAMYWTQIYT